MSTLAVLLTSLAFGACEAALTEPGASGGDGSALSLEITPSEAEGMPGDTIHFEATVVDGSGDAVSSYEISWSSSDSDLVTVDTDGVATVQDSGSATLTATATSTSGDTELTATAQVRGTVEGGGSDGGGDGSGSGSLVTELEPADYETDTLESGEFMYIDRDYTIDGVPSGVAGWAYVRTANDDKNTTGDSAITFELADSATVAVAYDDFATSLPTWLGEWTDTGEDLQTSVGTFSVFTRAFDAGDVALAGNMSEGAEDTQSMYVVLASSPQTGSDDGGSSGDTSQAPSAPSSLNVSATSSSRISGSFTDNSDNEAGFEVERNDGSGWVLAAELGTNDTNFGDTGLTPQTTYSYRVRAVNSAGASGYTAEASTTTPEQDTSNFGDYPNEPDGFSGFAEHDMAGVPGIDLGVLGDWGVSDGDNLQTGSDATAPVSPPSVVRGLFPNGMSDGGEPFRFDGWGPTQGTGNPYDELYLSLRMKIEGSDFQNQSVGTKMFYISYGSTQRTNHSFLLLDDDAGGGQSVASSFEIETYISEMNSDGSDPGGGAVGHGQNVDGTHYFTVGDWHNIELWMKANDIGSANGEFMLWIDGILVSHHTGFRFRSSQNPLGFWHFQMTPVYGGHSGDVRTQDDWWRFDHLYMSAP